jgi:hypothetical protein
MYSPELFTGQQASAANAATLEYYHSHAPVPSSLKLPEPFQKVYIKSLLHDMLHRDPDIRPSATLLRSTFSLYSRRLLVEKESETTIAASRSNNFEIAEDEGDGGVSWTKLDEAKGPVTFTLEGEKQVTSDCTVVHAIVNKPNSRIVLVCTDEDDDCLVIKLCKVSGTVLWEDKDPEISMPADKLILPAFNDDGTHLVVYLHSKINIIDARTGTLESSFSLDNNVVPTSIAISHDAKSTAITTATKVHDTDVDGGFYKLRIRDGKTTHTVHCIVWWSEPHAKLGYIANGRRIGASSPYHSGQGHFPGVLVLGYDVSARTNISRFSFGGRWAFREVYQNSIKVGVEECHIFQLGQRSGGNEARFWVYSGEDQEKGSFSCGRAIATFLVDGVVLLNDKYEVLWWSPGGKAVKVASLEGPDPPVLQSIRGIAVGENEIILVQDDGCFLFYNTQY